MWVAGWRQSFYSPFSSLEEKEARKIWSYGGFPMKVRKETTKPQRNQVWLCPQSLHLCWAQNIRF